jgi:hypothetical protein
MMMVVMIQKHLILRMIPTNFFSEDAKMSFIPLILKMMGKLFFS